MDRVRTVDSIVAGARFSKGVIFSVLMLFGGIPVMFKMAQIME